MQREGKQNQKQKEQQEAAKFRTQQMQQRFIDQLRQNKERNQSSSKHLHTVQPVEPKELKEERKKRKKVETELKKQKQKAQYLQKDYQVLAKKHRYVKDILYEEKQEKECLEKTIQQLRQENEQFRQENEQLTLQLNDQSDEAYLAERKKFQQEKQQLQKKNQQLLSAKKHHQKTIQSLQRKVKLLEGIKHGEKQANIQEKLLHLKRELQFYKQQVIQIEQSFSAQHYIEKLQQNLSVYTVDQYLIDGKNPFGPLGAEVSRVLKIQKEHEAKEKRMSQEETTPSLFGYLGKTKTGWVFFDLNYHSYDIATDEKKLSLKEGKPARAVVIDHHLVEIVHVLDVEPSEMKKTRQKRKQNLHKVESNSIDYPFFGTYHVLIVGSRNQSSYTDRLHKHGLIVQWHNPFEESYKRLNGKYQKADAVIVCTRHIPHSVLDHIDKKNEKVELLERDNEEILASRIPYLLERLTKTDG